MLSHSIHTVMCVLAVLFTMRFHLAFVSHIYDMDFGFHYHRFFPGVCMCVFCFIIFRFGCITSYSQILKKRLIRKPFISFFALFLYPFHCITCRYRINTWPSCLCGVFSHRINSFVSAVYFIKLFSNYLLCDYFMVLFLFCHGTCQLGYKRRKRKYFSNNFCYKIYARFHTQTHIQHTSCTFCPIQVKINEKSLSGSAFSLAERRARTGVLHLIEEFVKFLIVF